MKIKINNNVIHGGWILKRGDVHDLSDEHATLLIGGKHAEKAPADAKLEEPPVDPKKKPEEKK